MNNILFILTSVETSPLSQKPTSFWLEELAVPYFIWLDNPSKLNQIRKNGYKLYKKKYSNKIYVKRMENYFLKISKSHDFKYSKNYNFVILLKLKILSFISEFTRFLKKVFFKIRLKKKYQL